MINESISHTTVVKQQPVSILKLIVLSWLLIGTLDILLAVVQSLIYGGKPIKMFQFIASGVFGKQAFSGGALYALYGLLLHYCIAFTWTLVFFNTCRKLKYLTNNWILAGIGYGVFVWVVMNFIVLPLSNTPPLKFHLLKTIISMLTIIVAIGLPLSFIANKFFLRTGALNEVSDDPISKGDL